MEIFATLDGYTADELIEVKRYIDTKLATMKADKLKSLLSELEAWGISASELNGHAKEVADNKSKLAAKYRNPDNPHETWVGRGKSPNWFLAQQEKGVSKEDMLIK